MSRLLWQSAFFTPAAFGAYAVIQAVSSEFLQRR